jgi:hypothetical protein
VPPSCSSSFLWTLSFFFDFGFVSLRYGFLSQLPEVFSLNFSANILSLFFPFSLGLLLSSFLRPATSTVLGFPYAIGSSF